MSSTTSIPVIRRALGAQWENLHEIVQRHYAITPGESSRMVIRGNMSEVYHSHIAKLFLLPGRLFGALVPYKGRNIPTEVRNWTTAQDQRAMFWHRTLRFPGRSPVIFQSRMEHRRHDEIIEFVKFGMGIRMRISVEDSALIFRSIGYVWKIGGAALLIPNWLILGDAEIIEKGLSESEFFIDFNIIHPLFGKTFSYTGIFSIIEEGDTC
ncbi:DUF4166 domain-containing protein [Sedimenticola hydrogenitrophicus]|uniref:DUF4166 domain-containing protein n=1 Tax=Sedimenticola hydrogenitrophicus TaxID=2967975 RepID=UPI0021A37D31|nr:DUF4166 domain-containing protein [Sedimenticola hydrogenitrophicus]